MTIETPHLASRHPRRSGILRPSLFNDEAPSVASLQSFWENQNPAIGKPAGHNVGPGHNLSGSNYLCCGRPPATASLVNRLLALFLAVLVLLQTLGQEVLVVDYQLHKARITELYCVNKARPQLHCNGKCHLINKLRKADATEKKAPAGALAKVKYEVLPTAGFTLRPPQPWRLPVRRYLAQAMARCVAVPGAGVFRPPLV